MSHVLRPVALPGGAPSPFWSAVIALPGRLLGGSENKEGRVGISRNTLVGAPRLVQDVFLPSWLGSVSGRLGSTRRCQILSVSCLEGS